MPARNDTFDAASDRADLLAALGELPERQRAIVVAHWGTFDSGFAVPASAHGSITLEVFEVSAQDGSDRGIVKIPLTVP